MPAEQLDFPNSQEQVRVLGVLDKHGVVLVWDQQDPRTLEEVIVTGQRFDDSLLALLEGKHFPPSCYINVGKASMTSGGLGRLWESFPNAAGFGCSDVRLDSDDFAEPRPGQLRRFSLARANVDKRLLEKMLPFQRFDTLHFRNTNFGDDDFLLVNQYQCLETLSLNECCITSQCLPAIGRCSKLTWLSLSHANIDDKAMVFLGELERLEGLLLDDTSVGDHGIDVLLKLPNLRDLRLDGTRITDTGLLTLAQVPRLYSLDLSRTHVTIRGLMHLQEHPNLTSVTVDNTAITREEFSKFYHALPAVRRKLKGGQ